MTADDRGWCAYPSEAKRDPASTLDLPRGEDDGSAASRASRVAMTRVKVPSACCEFDEDATDGGEADEDGLIEVDVTIDVDRGDDRRRARGDEDEDEDGGEEETADYAESDEDEDGSRASSGDGREDVLTDVRGHTHTYR